MIDGFSAKRSVGWFDGEKMNDMDGEWRKRQAAQIRASAAERRASEAEMEAARLWALLKQKGIEDK